MQPGTALSAEGGDLLPIVGATDDRADGDNEDVDEQMTWSASWVFKAAKVGLDSQICGSHCSPP